VVLSRGVTFEEFAVADSARLRAGLVAAYGPDVGADAAAEAMAYAFEHWDRLSSMSNPVGYLYRVGQTEARRQLRPRGYLPAQPARGLPEFEPALAPALEALTEPQRVAVVMVHALGWAQVDVAAVLEVDVSTLRTHLARALRKLRLALEVTSDV
jgi:DNA-directed RNA polymerase specialized sigma24 family protein